jgi:hypothetical protein
MSRCTSVRSIRVTAATRFKECALIGDHGHRPGAQHLGGPLPLGRGRVNGSDVIIALLREMMRNEAPQTKIVDVIEREGRR